MKATKKKRTGLIIALVVVLVIVAAGAAYAWNLYSQALQEKQEIYALAEKHFADGNYRDAYRTYLQVEGFEDATEKAAQMQKLMDDNAKTHTALAQHLSDLKFNTIAGLYLTEVLSSMEKQFALDDYNAMAAMISDYYALATQQYAEVMTIDDKMLRLTMEDLMPRIEALEETKNAQDAMQILNEVTTFSLADQVFFHCWENGAFDNTTLDVMAQNCPIWAPMMDQVIAADANLDVLALVNRS